MKTKLDWFKKQLKQGKSTILIPDDVSKEFEHRCIENVKDYAKRADKWRALSKNPGAII